MENKTDLKFIAKKSSYDSQIDDLINDFKQSSELLSDYRNFNNKYINQLEELVRDLNTRVNSNISEITELKNELSLANEKIIKLNEDLIEADKLINPKNLINLTKSRSKSKLFGLF